MFALREYQEHIDQASGLFSRGAFVGGVFLRHNGQWQYCAHGSRAK